MRKLNTMADNAEQVYFVVVKLLLRRYPNVAVHLHQVQEP
jgi:hypothetical protein